MSRPRTQLRPTILKFGPDVSKRKSIVGFDLSLRGLGVVRLPLDWMKGNSHLASKCWFGNVAGWAISYPMPMSASENQRAHRTAELARLAIDCVSPFEWAGDELVKVAIFEEIAFRAGGSRTSEIIELSGALKSMLVRRGIRVESVHASSARKLFLGKNPTSDPKGHVAAALKELGAPFWEAHDVADAWVVANYGASSVGTSVTIR